MNGSMSSGELLKRVRYFALNYRQEENYIITQYKGKEVKSFPLAEDANIVIGNGICSLLISSTIIGGSIYLGEDLIKAEYNKEYKVFEFNFILFNEFTGSFHSYFETLDIFVTMEFFVFKDNNKKYIK